MQGRVIVSTSASPNHTALAPTPPQVQKDRPPLAWCGPGSVFSGDRGPRCESRRHGFMVWQHRLAAHVNFETCNTPEPSIFPRLFNKEETYDDRIFLTWWSFLWYHGYSSVQFSCSVVSYSLPPHGLQHANSMSITKFWNLLKLMSVASVMPSNHLILCHPLLLLPSVFPRIRVYSSESVVWIRWPKYWSFTFSISPSNWFPLGLTGLIFLQSQGLSRDFCNTIIQKHQFFSAQLSL